MRTTALFVLRIVLITATSSAFLATGISCSKVREKSGTSKNPSADDFPGAITSDLKDIYPHSTAFRTTNLHGKKHSQNETTCKVCHGKDLSGGTSSVSCKSCHSAYPHEESFKLRTHGEAFFADRVSCFRCHGNETKNGGGAARACATCHSFPHEPNWGSAQNHGQKYLAERDALANPTAGVSPPAVSCENCHGAQKKLSTSPLCSTCHTIIPHGEEFVMGGHAATARALAGKCIQCHTDFKRLMPTFANGCRDCHEGNLSESTWVVPSPSPTPAPSLTAAPAPAASPSTEAMRAPSSSQKKLSPALLEKIHHRYGRDGGQKTPRKNAN